MEDTDPPLFKQYPASLSATVINFIIQKLNLTEASSSSKQITTKQVGIPCYQSCLDGNTVTAVEEGTEEIEIQIITNKTKGQYLIIRSLSDA